MADVQSAPVTDNPARQRFELVENGQTAFADYRRRQTPTGVVLVIAHVETPAALRGAGVAGRLMAGVVAQARREGVKIVPTCGYAAAWFQRHPEEADLLA